MDNFVVQIDETIGLLCNLDRIIDSKYRDYGCGFELSAREIHTLEAIVNHPSLNATELTEMLGFQKGTFSKVASRLEQWGLIQRYQNEKNRKEIFFRCTELGERAYQGHYRFHEHTSSAAYQRFQHYTKEEQAVILRFLSDYIQYLKDYF